MEDYIASDEWRGIIYAPKRKDSLKMGNCQRFISVLRFMCWCPKGKVAESVLSDNEGQKILFNRNQEEVTKLKIAQRFLCPITRDGYSVVMDHLFRHNPEVSLAIDQRIAKLEKEQEQLK